jgi:hypothetical protein
MSQKMFFGGVPVDPEVKMLRSHFGVPVHGQVIAHEDCETVLGLDRKSSRYKTVIHAWRSSLKRSDNIEFIALPGEGFRVLFDDERVEVHISGVSRGIRKIDRSARSLASVPRDGSPGEDVHLHARIAIRPGTARAFSGCRLAAHGIGRGLSHAHIEATPQTLSAARRVRRLPSPQHRRGLGSL